MVLLVVFCFGLFLTSPNKFDSCFVFSYINLLDIFKYN